ncbi:MAG: NIPSNAP family protein [Verrucomicrobia bacterium]|nr:NIPSNAP family protein [Verrucomicrobiota bacterium]
MKRRDFLKSSLAATSLAAMSSAFAAESKKSAAREYYELRHYTLRRGPMPARFDDFFEKIAVPAWNRAGVANVGVFDVAVGNHVPAKYVLLASPSFDALSAAKAKFDADPAVRAAEFTNLPATDPAYVRAESSLLLAFGSIPKMELPAKQPRVFELRCYESHSKAANRKKIEMFDTGEIALFRKTGLAPVFFGETLIGPKLPNLTYLLVFPDMAVREKNWDAFRSHPDWKKMSATPGFTDPEIVTNIGNTILKPTAYSQV